MLARAASWWMIFAALAAVALAIVLLHAVIRWALARVTGALDIPVARVVLGTGAIVLAALFAIEYPQNLDAHERRFPTPITTTYWRQVRLAVDAMRGGRSVPASPRMNSNFSRVQGADVVLLFIESYGAVTFDRPEFAAPLEAVRRTLGEAIHATGRQSVSAFVESSTFGGESWLAHISLMSGVEVRDPHTNAVLMTQHRETIVDAFSRHGYRTVANMPGLWWDWPEGSFYGFDDVYGAVRLDYRGPQFGWFTLTDQFALARIDALEIERAPRKPLFIFFPTVSTHAPFTPTPPFQPDWGRMFDERPYDPADLDRSFEDVADWLNLGPGYVKAVDYTLRTIAGYLQLRAGRDLVMIVIGDHQPAAAVAGERASWDVPVHVIASRPDLLASLRTHGFAEGLTPRRPILGPMHELLPVLLKAFGEPE
jgi:hypothetical protein